MKHTRPAAWNLILLLLAMMAGTHTAHGQWSDSSIDRVCSDKQLSSYFRQAYNQISKNLDSACYYGERGLSQAIRVNNTPAKCLGYILLSRTYLLTPDYAKALEYLDIADALKEHTDSPELDAYISYVRAVRNMMLGKLQEAIEETARSVKVYEKLHDTAGMVSLDKFMGNLYLMSGEASDLEKGKKKFYRALDLQTRQRDFARVGGVYGSLARVFIMQNRLDSAQINLLKAIEFNTRYDNRIWLATDIIRLGEIKMSYAQFDSAEYYMKQAERYLSHPNDKALYFVSLGKVKRMKKDYPGAVSFYLQAYALVKESNNQPTLLSVIRELAAIAEERGDQATALRYIKEYAQLKDTLDKTEKIPTISLLEIQRQHDLKTRQMELEQEKIALTSQRKSSYIISLVILTILLILISLVIIFFLRLRQRAISMEKAELDKALEFKNRELALQVMNLMKRNEFIIETSRRLMEIPAEQHPEEMKTEVIRIAKSLQDQTDKEIWEEFELRFRQVHTGFYERLLANFPDLTPNELKMCGLLRLNLSTKEMSELTGQRREAIEMARFRLRKHLGLHDPQVNLVTFLGKI